MQNTKIAKGKLINQNMSSNTFRVREVITIFNAGQNISELYITNFTVTNVKGNMIKNFNNFAYEFS